MRVSQTQWNRFRVSFEERGYREARRSCLASQEKHWLGRVGMGGQQDTA
jgi:hypothetical protein